jgi:hypothetical protein
MVAVCVRVRCAYAHGQHSAANFSFINPYSNQSGLAGYNSEDGFHFQHRNSGKFPVKGLTHDNGCTLVCAKYGYLKGSPNTNS